MQLDKLIVETRVRSAWSAIDLGFSLARHFWLRAFCLYLLMAVPVYCLTLLLDKKYTYLPIFIIWWLKPVFERPILFMISRELFSEPMSVKRVFRQTRLWLTPSFFWITTWRRLSVYRGMTAPIMLLEQPKGGAYSKRASVLSSKSSSEAMWLTVVLYHIETFLFLGIIALIALFFPQAAEAIYKGLFVNASERFIYTEILGVLSMAIIAPFYAISGFMLYISRRIELEGWDIEITFRNWMSDYRAPIEHTQINDGNLSKTESLGVKQ